MREHLIHITQEFIIGFVLNLILINWSLVVLENYNLFKIL